MRDYVEFMSIWTSQDDIITGEPILDNGLVSIDLNEIESFYESVIAGHTAIILVSGTSYNVKVQYKDFKVLMKKHRANIINYEQAAKQN